MVTLRPWNRWLEWPRGRRLAVVLAVVLTLPAIAMGFFLDDNIHHVQALGTTFIGSRFDQFKFVTGDPAMTMPYVRTGPFPWWTLPELKLSFFRPLSSALITLDATLFGGHAWAHHVHSTAWYVAFVLVASLLLRLALPGAVGVAALLLFALDDTHWFPTAWLANRNALVATTPVLLAVWAHVRFRTGGGAKFLGLSVLLVLVGLSGGEASLGALAYLVAWEVAAARDGLKQRISGLIPFVLLVAGYLAVYRWTGSGAYGSATYVDPVSTPLKFLSVAPERALALLSGLVFGVNVEPWGADPRLPPVYAAVGLLAVSTLGWAHLRLRGRLPEEERRGLDWLLSGALLSLVPVLATFPSQRLLLVPSLGGAAFVAVLVRETWGHARRSRRVAAWGLVSVHVGVSLLTWPVMHYAGATISRLTEQVAFDSPMTDAQWAGRVVLPVAPDFSVMMVPVVRRREGHALPERWWMLSFGKGDHRLVRTGERTVELSLVGGPLLTSMWETQLRSVEHPFAEGEVVALDGARVTVKDVVGGRPGRISVEFDVLPEGPGWTWVRYDDFRLVPFALPAVGGEVLLPRRPGPLGP